MLFLPFFTLAISPILHTREAMIYALEVMVHKVGGVEQYLPDYLNVPDNVTQERMFQCLPTLYRPTFHYAPNGKLDVLTVDGLFLPINSERNVFGSLRRLRARRTELSDLSEQIQRTLEENLLHGNDMLVDEDKYLPFPVERWFLQARMYEYELRLRGIYLAYEDVSDLVMRYVIRPVE